jgi:phosphoribosyl-AMP cyclohydrolase
MSEELRAAIIQDDQTGRVLMLGWMDEEALSLTRSTGLVHFFSRSRQKLWQKGETSGNTLHAVEVLLDCDEDAVLVRASADGPTCHDGSTSCFTPGSGERYSSARRRVLRSPTSLRCCARARRSCRGRSARKTVELVVAALS